MTGESCELLCLDLPHAEAVRAALPAFEPLDRAAADARALGDPTRLRVAAALAAGDELCVCDLAWVCDLAQNLVSHHVRQLRTAGLTASCREGKMVMYRLTDRGAHLLHAVLPASVIGLVSGDHTDSLASGRG